MTYATLNDLTDAEILAVEEQLVQAFSERFPLLDLTSGGVLRDVMIRPAAMLQALNNRNIENLRISQSISEITANPTLADDAVVDAILSNFLLSRRTGTFASGTVVVVISEKVTTTIVAGSILTSINGMSYTTLESFTGVTDASLVVSDTDRVITPLTNGNYAFSINVTAVESGVASRAKKGTQFTFSVNPPRLVQAYAAADFTGGSEDETNTSAMSRLQAGLTAKIPSGRAQIEAMLRSQFAEVIDVSVIGFQDPEMRRDSRNLFGISSGGKADVFVRTADVPVKQTISVTATLQNKEQQIWSLDLPSSIAAGLYRVDALEHAGGGGAIEISLITRGKDTTGSDFIPYMSENDHVFSRYQTVRVIFYDYNTVTDDLSENVSTKDYDLTYTAMPLIADIQDFISNRGNRSPLNDILIRPSIPCFVGVEFFVQRYRSDPEISTGPLIQAVVDTVNAFRFKHGRMAVSDITRAVEDLLPENSSVRLPIHVYGTLLLPDGSTLTAHATDLLDITEDLENSLSSRTVSFYCRTEDVSITITNLDVKEV